MEIFAAVVAVLATLVGLGIVFIAVCGIITDAWSH